MATIKAIVRTTKKNTEVNIRFRVSDGRDVQLFHNSDIKVNIDIWDSKNDCVKARAIFDAEKKNQINRSIIARKQLLLDTYEANKTKVNLTSDVFEKLVDEVLHPEKYKKTKDSFFDILETYLDKRKLSDVRDKNFRVLVRALKRYELFYQIHNNNLQFSLNIDTIDSNIIEDFEDFLRNEYILVDEYPNIYKKIPAILNSKQKFPKPKPRGNNTICALFNKLRAFFNWCNEQDITTNRPFYKYNGVKTEKYGTPIYITLEERDLIANFDLSKFPNLEVQRDIFIFQCHIGCRVSDLSKMTTANIINGAIEYIPKKTQDENPQRVRVPLTKTAKKLIEKHKGTDKQGRLFSFISAQKYNDSIKEVFTYCGITRMVTVLNPTTGKEEKQPINEIVASHLARKTFVGNLYKKVKDPNIVGSMSGHKEGSKAFARYRDIDDDIKKDAIQYME